MFKCTYDYEYYAYKKIQKYLQQPEEEFIICVHKDVWNYDMEF